MPSPLLVSRVLRNHMVRQIAKYFGLMDKCTFQPIVVKSLCPLNETAWQFLKDFGRRISILSDEERERLPSCSKDYLLSFSDSTLSCSTTVLGRQTTRANSHSSVYISLTNFFFPRPRYRRCLGHWNNNLTETTNKEKWKNGRRCNNSTSNDDDDDDDDAGEAKVTSYLGIDDMLQHLQVTTAVQSLTHTVSVWPVFFLCCFWLMIVLVIIFISLGCWFLVHPASKTHWVTLFLQLSCPPQPLQPRPSWCP